MQERENDFLKILRARARGWENEEKEEKKLGNQGAQQSGQGSGIHFLRSPCQGGLPSEFRFPCT